MDWKTALEHVHVLARMPAWRDIGPPLVALLSGRSLSRTLRGIFGDTLMDSTPIPFLPVCASVESGEVFVPDQGPLWLALRASASLPGIFPPVPWQKRLLMDGALVNNLPADLLRLRCPSGHVIASDVGLPTLRTDYPEDLHSTSGWRLLIARMRGLEGHDARASFVDLLTGAACAASTRHLALIREGIDCYIAPSIADHATLSRRNGQDIDVMVERGYEAARRALEESPL
jgi:NTE family protein